MSAVMEYPERFWINTGIAHVQMRTGDEQPIFTDILRTILQTNAKKVLDIGCGAGLLGQMLQAVNWGGTYFGVDVNPYAVACLQANGLEGEEANLRWLDYRKRNWDIVVMKDVLEHLESPALLSRIIPLARYHFIISLSLPLQVKEIRQHLPNGLYANYYALDDIQTLFRQCGFELSAFHQITVQSNPRDILTFKRKGG